MRDIDLLMRRVDHDVLLLAVDREIRRHELLRAIEIETVFRRLLVVPLVLAGLRIERKE